MKRFVPSLCVILLLAALGAGAWWLQRPQETARAEQAVPAPSRAAELIVAGLEAVTANSPSWRAG